MRGDGGSVHRLYAERVARRVPIDSRGRRVVSLGRLHYLLAQHCKLPRRVRNEFIRELEVRGLVVIENKARIVLCVDWC